MTDTSKISICPLCGQKYTDRPALSRVDNKTLICPDCGTRQALATLGIGAADQDRYLAAIYEKLKKS